MTTPNIDELITKVRMLENDHAPDGWPAIRMADISTLVEKVQSQAERIKTLEDSQATMFGKWEAECELANSLRDERDTLRAQMEAIEKTEPVGAIYTIAGVQHCTITKTLDDTDLFARPMLALPVVGELVKALSMLLSYTKACEGLLNCTPAGQIAIAEDALSKYKGAKL